MNIVSTNLDSIVYFCLKEILNLGSVVSARNRPTKEILGYSFTLTNPLARLYTNPIRNLNIFSTVGRMCWEMSASNNSKAMEYYTDSAKLYANEEGIIPSAYGYRILPQIPLIVDTLQKDPDSRRAYINILDNDFRRNTVLEYPCIIGLQFFLRNGKLDMEVFSRSQSAFWILPIDVFVFTTIHEYVASLLKVDLGKYMHTCGSIHYYLAEEPLVKQLLAKYESDGPDKFVQGDLSVVQEYSYLLNMESIYRTGKGSSVKIPDYSSSTYDQYILLFAIFAAWKSGDLFHVNELLKYAVYPYAGMMTNRIFKKL
ncbi:hypothetical protein HY041_02775 [Candidatus Roizmanbacteria bacterium]|nr:hypothetical protein [Candidatus Roizmanbacteria bacterium]